MLSSKELNCVHSFVEVNQNVSDRNTGAKIESIVIHHTAISGFRLSKQVLTEKGTGYARVSAHFLIRKNGEIWQLCPLAKKAWHAGVSAWRGLEETNLNDPTSTLSLNHRSVGIEIVNSGYEPFTDLQMESVTALCKELKTKYDIRDSCIVGHADCAPGRKVDPHIGFSWYKLYKAGVGIYSEINIPKQDIKFLAKPWESGEHVLKFKGLLKSIGYRVEMGNAKYDKAVSDVVRAFARHFCPEFYKNATQGWNNLFEVRAMDLAKQCECGK